jgi:hypothetical protein
MFDKINISDIYRHHVASLRDHSDSRNATALGDLALFFGFPLLIGAVAWWREILIPSAALSGLLSAYSVFMGLLPSLLVMVVTFLGTTKGDPSNEPALKGRKMRLRELSANLSFAILLALLLVTVAMIALMVDAKVYQWTPRIWSPILVAGSALFLLTLLMILKRIYAIVLNELDRHKFNRAA